MDEYSRHSPSGEEYADISLIGISRTVRQYKYVATGIFFASVVVSLLVAFLSTPVYRASILVSPVSGGSTAVSGISRLLRGMGAGAIFNAIGTSSS